MYVSRSLKSNLKKWNYQLIDHKTLVELGYEFFIRVANCPNRTGKGTCVSGSQDGSLANSQLAFNRCKVKRNVLFETSLQKKTVKFRTQVMTLRET